MRGYYKVLCRSNQSSISCYSTPYKSYTLCVKQLGTSGFEGSPVRYTVQSLEPHHDWETMLEPLGLDGVFPARVVVRRYVLCPLYCITYLELLVGCDTCIVLQLSDLIIHLLRVISASQIVP